MWRLILVLSVCCAESAALAQSRPEYRDWEFAGFAGGSFGDSFRFATPVFGSDRETSRTVGMQYSPGYLVGVRLSQYFNDFWAADLEYSYSLQNLRFTNLSPDVQRLSVNNYIHHIDYNVAYMPLPRDSRFRPYVNAGTGAVLFFINGESLSAARQQGLNLRQSTWEFRFNLGGGVKYLVMDQFAVSLDVKNSLSGIPKYAVPSSTQVIDGQYHPGIAVDGIMQNWQLSAAANFQWDEWNFRRRKRRN
jgi:opacity protein-like surface antigen